MAIATLPIVLSVVLTELAVGGSFLGWWVDRGGRAPGGFLKLVAFVDAGAIAAALALVPTFPGGDLAARAGVDTGPLSAFGQALVLVTILMVTGVITAAYGVGTIVASFVVAQLVLRRPGRPMFAFELLAGLSVLAIGLVPTLLALMAGIYFRSRLDQARFRQLIVVLLVLSVANLLWRTFGP